MCVMVEHGGWRQHADLSCGPHKMLISILQTDQVDYEIMRGIALHCALQRSEFWTSPDEIRRTHRVAEVWRLSTPVDRRSVGFEK